MVLIGFIVCIFVIGFIDGSFGELSTRKEHFVKSCAPTFCPVETKLAFEPGWSYLYNYEANVVTSISGTSEDFTGIFIESQVELHVVRPCEFQLKLRNVDLRSRDMDDPAPRLFATGHSEFKKALEERTVYFAYVDGTVRDVCVDADEVPWALNIKRAIISAFQNTAKSFWKSSHTMERDVLGDCPTDYQIDFQFTSITMKKSKDLDHCRGRHLFSSGIQSTPYSSAEGSPVSPMLNSSYECEQTLEDGVINKVSCIELHLLKPFSNGQNGAQTMTRITLLLINQVWRPTPQIKKDEKYVLTSLLFEHDYKSPKSSIDHNSTMREAESTLSELCVGSLNDVNFKTPQLFWRLRTKLSELDYESLTKVFGSVDRICNFTPRGQKFFRDVLPMIGTVASVTLMKDFILDHSVPEAEVDSWLSVLAFHPKPTKEIIRALLPLLTETTPSPKTLLTVSSLVHSFCQRTNIGQDCENYDEVKFILIFIQDRLRKNCPTNSPDEVRMMVSMLKAVGNLGRWRGGYSIALEQCLDKGNNVLVRLTAIHAYRRFSCRVSREHLMRRFLDSEEDVEIRIASYLAMMKCPTRERIEAIWHALDVEKINQVNSFVWSHLETVSKSSNPDDKLVVSILEDTLLQEKYSMDMRKFSRAFGSSAFSEILNIGASVDGGVIYSPSAFLPRSAYLNLTVLLFGRSINLIEINGRAQGLERLAEAFFRPEPPAESESEDGSGSTVDTFGANTEDRRLNEISEEFHASGETRNAIGDRDLSISAKLFGQEVWHSHTSTEKIDDSVHRLTDLTWMDILERLATDNTFELSRDSILIDTSYVVPTVAGLPLMLDLNVTASVNVQFGGRLDIRQMAIGLCDIEGHVKPSAAVVAKGTMAVDGYVGLSGVKLDASLTSSTLLDGKLKLTSQGQVKFHLNIPRDKMEFIGASTDLVLIHWNVDRPLRIPETTDSVPNPVRCSTDYTHRSLGISICTQLAYANASLRSASPYYPLTGPSRIDLYLQKTDPKLTHYLLEYIWNVNQVRESTETILFSFRTPRSLVDREWTAEYLLNRTEKYILLRFLSPNKKVIVKGRYFDDPTRRGLLANMEVDGRETFSFQSDLTMDIIREDHHYQPKIIIRVPTHTVLHLEGLVRFHQNNKQLNVDLSLEKFTLKPIVLRGEVSTSTDGSTRYESSFASPLLNFSLKGSVNLIEGGLSSKTNVEYLLASSSDESEPKRRETIDFTTKLRYESPVGRASTSLSATVNVHTSAVPEYSTIATWEYRSADGHLENTVTLDRPDDGDIVKAQIARFQQIFSYNGTLEHNKAVGKLEVKIPSRDVFLLFNVDHQNTLQMVHSKINFRGSAGKEYGAEVRVLDESTDTLMTSGFFRLVADGRATGMSLSATEERPVDATPVRFVVRAVCYGRLFGDSNVSLNYTNESHRLVFKHFLRMNIVGDRIKMHGIADLLLTNSRGILVVDANMDEERYRLNGDYLRLNLTEHEISLSMRSSIRDHNQHSARFRISTGLEKTLSFEIRSKERRRLEGNAGLLITYGVRSSSLNLAWDPEEDPSRSFNISLRREKDLDLTYTKLHVIYMKSAAVLGLDYRQQGTFTSGHFDQSTKIFAIFDDVKGLDLNLGLHYIFEMESRMFSGFVDSFTPMFALRKLMLNASHEDDGRRWKSQGSFDVNDKFPLKMISAGKSWQLANQGHTEAEIQLETPISGFDNFSIKIAHDLASRETRSKARLQWTLTMEPVLLEARVVRPNTATYDFLVGTINLTTPFTSHRHVQVVVNHLLSQDQIESRVYWKNDGVDVFGVSINGDIGLKDHYYELTGNLTIKTPMEAFDKFVVAIGHSYDSDGFRSEIVSFLPNTIEPVFMRLEASRVRSLMFNLNIVSMPDCNFGFDGHWNTDPDVHIEGPIGGLRAHFNEMTANASVDGFYHSFSDFVVEASVQTSMTYLEMTAVTLRNRIKRRNIDSMIRLYIGGSTTAAIVDAKWYLNGNDSVPLLNVTVRLDTPFSIARHALVNIAHLSSDKSESGHRTNVRGVWNNGSLLMDNHLVLHGGFNLDYVLILSLPWEKWSGFAFSINNSVDFNHGGINSFARLFQFDVPIFSLDINGNSRLDGGHRRRVIGQIKFFSNFRKLRYMNISVDHMDDGTDFKPVITCNVSDVDGPIVVTGYMTSSLSGKEFRLGVTSSIPEYETVGLAGMYLLHDTKVEWAFSSQWRNSSRIEVSCDFVIDLMAPKLKLTMQTPIPGYSVFKLDGSYDVWSPRKQATAVVIKEDWSVEMTGSGNFDTELFDTHLSMETSNPYESHLIIHLNASGQWKSETKSLKAGISWADDRLLSVAIGLRPTINGDGTSLAATLDAIYGADQHRNTSFLVSVYSKSKDDIHCDVFAIWDKVNNVEMKFEMLKKEEIPLNCSFVVNSATPSIPPVIASLLVMRSNVKNLNRIETTFQIKEHKMSALWDLKYLEHGNGLNLEASVETPLNAFRKASLSGSIANDATLGDQYRVNSILMLSTGDVKIDGKLKRPSSVDQTSQGTLIFTTDKHGTTTSEVDFRISQDSFDASLKSDAPISTLWKLTAAQVHYHRKRMDCVLKMYADTADEHHHVFTGQMSQNSNDVLKINTTLITPFISMDENSNSHWDLGVFFARNRTSISVFDGEAFHSLEMFLSNNDKMDMKFKLIANSSMLSTTCHENDHLTNSVYASSDMSRTVDGFGASVAVTTPCDLRYSSTGFYRIDQLKGIIVLFVDVLTPLEHFRRLKIDAYHHGSDWDNADIHLRLVTPISGYEKFGTAFRTLRTADSTFELDVFVDTPFRGYENISLSERIVYDGGLASETNFTYDGIVVDFEARYLHGRTGSELEFGIGGRWRAHDPYNRNTTIDNVTKGASVGFVHRGQKYVIDYSLLGTPWEIDGTLKYAGLRLFNGETNIGHLQSLDGGSTIYGIRIGSDFLRYSEEATNDIAGQLGLQWGTRNKSILINYAGSMTPTKFEGCFNLTSGFTKVRFIDGHLATVKGTRGIVTSATLNTDSTTLVDATLQWMSDDNNIWRNRSIAVHMDNVYQPFGVAITTSKRSSAYWCFHSNFDWNLTHPNLDQSSANVLIEIVGPSRRSPEKTFHLSVDHPKHRVDLQTNHLKTDNNLTLFVVLLWGSDNDGVMVLQPLVQCKIWWVVNSKDVGKLDGGFRWSHPGRTLLATARKTLIKVLPEGSEIHLDFWWDVDRHPKKHVAMDMEYTKHLNTSGTLIYNFDVILRSPRLMKEVRLNGNASVNVHRTDLSASFDLDYSPDPGDLLSVDVMLVADEAGVYILRTSANHSNAQLASGLEGKWYRDRLKGKTSAAITIRRLIISDESHLHEIYIGVLVDNVKRNITMQFTDSDADSNAIHIVMREESPNKFTGIITGYDKGHRQIVLHQYIYKSLKPSLDADFAYGTSVLQLRSGLRSPTLGLIYIGRKGVAGFNDTTRDASFAINLNTSRLVTVYCNWTSDITDSLPARNYSREAVNSHVEEVRGRIRVGLVSVWSASVAEVIAKSKPVVRSLAAHLQPIADEATTEIDAMWSDVESLQDRFDTMYDDNDFLMKDILLFTDQWSDYAREWRKSLKLLPFTWTPMSMSQWLEDVLQKIDDLFNLFMYSWYDWSARKLDEYLMTVRISLIDLNDFLSQMGGRLYDTCKNVSSFLSGAQSTDFSVHLSRLSSVGENLISVWRIISSTVNGVYDWVKGRFDAIVSLLFTNDAYINIHGRVIGTVSAIHHFFTIRIYDYLNRFLIEIKRFMSPEQQKLIDEFLSNLIALRDTISTLPTIFVKQPVFDEIVDITSAFYQKILWMLHYYQLLPRGWETILNVYNEVTYLFGTRVEVASDKFDSPNYVLLDMENKKFELVQTLPFPWINLHQLPHFGQIEELRSLRRLWKTIQSTESDNRMAFQAAPLTPTAIVPSVFVWWNDVSSKLDVVNWLPPFQARAMLIGYQHYVTFDNHITDFAGPCSYLLTRDFVDSNFTVYVNYDDPINNSPKRRSLTVKLEESEIELILTSPHSPQVYIDGRKVELPQHFGRTNIVREIHRLTIDHGYGFTLSCHLQYDVCTFVISGWYLGRVGGLLGTYNYEASDDVKTPNGRSADSDLASWGESWRVYAPADSIGAPTIQSPGACSTVKNLAVLPLKKNVEVYGKHCMELFNSSRSIFRLCYDKLNPVPYFQMCLSDTQFDESPQNVCTVAAAYVDRCLSQNVPVRIPKFCVRCALPDGNVILEGHSQVIRSSTNSKKADVVFIVEAKKCNRNFPNIYGDFVASVDSALNRANVNQRRFATVVFGGSGFQDEPRVHTVDSQIFVGQRVISGLPNFVVGRGSATVFDAFRFAAKLPFEAGASKTFVLVACSVGDDVEMKTDYPEVHWLLLEDGITLHLLLDREFDTKKPHTFYGMDGQRAYTVKDARSRELKGDEDLRRQVAPPKDYHVPIALEVNGTVFSSARLYGRQTSLSPSVASNVKQVAVKRFLDVFARRLAQSASADVCHHCECFPAEDIGVGRLYCHPCVFPRPAHVYTGPDDSDFDEDEVSALLQPGTLDKVKNTDSYDVDYEYPSSGYSSTKTYADSEEPDNDKTTKDSISGHSNQSKKSRQSEKKRNKG